MADSSVAATMIRTLVALHTETRRRGLAGPLEPIEDVIGQIIEAVERTDLNDFDKASVSDLVPDELTTSSVP